MGTGGLFEVESAYLLFERGRYGGVHVADQEDGVVEEDGLGLLEAHFFDLEGELVDLFEVSDSAFSELSALFELAPHEDQLAVEEVEPDEVGALVGHESIVVGSEFQRTLLYPRYSLSQLMPRVYHEQVVVLVLGLHLHVLLFVHSLANGSQPLIRLS